MRTFLVESKFSYLRSINWPDFLSDTFAATVTANYTVEELVHRRCLQNTKTIRTTIRDQEDSSENFAEKKLNFIFVYCRH